MADVTAHATMSTRTKFARRFVRSLSKMKKNDGVRVLGSASASDEEIFKRSRRIKLAAYSSMARAVGSKRVWSRALLFKLRNRARTHGFSRKRCSRVNNRKKKRVMRDHHKPSGSAMLRKLVPGGDGMDICSLLEETAHYIKCLATQVKVMQSIADHFSK